jgi:hypothetical protein
MPFALPALASVAWTTWVAIGITVASMAYSYLKRPGEPPKPDLSRMGAGMKVNSRSTQEPIRVVYGTQKVGGNIVYQETNGEDNNYFYMILCLSEGPCDSINQVSGVDQIWVGDTLANSFGSMDTPGGTVSYFFHSGSSDQSVDATINQHMPTFTDYMRNTCYVAMVFTYDRDKFMNLPSILVELKGRKLYDFRDSTTAYSANPVLVLYDYMTNTRYGMGMASTKIDTSSWEDAADYCDTQGWEIHFALSENQPAADIRDLILMHFRGAMVWYDGKYYLRYADLNAESSVRTLTDADVLHEESGKSTLSISESSQFSVPDAVRVRWIDPEKGYAEDDFIIGDETGVVKQLDLLGCTDREQAGQLGTYNLERWQMDRSISGIFKDDAICLEPHDLITLSSDALSISSQLMRVTEANIQPDGTVELILAYEDLSMYNDVYDITLDNVYNCTLPDPKSEPPIVADASISEEQYNYRLRTFTRLNITFTRPSNYPWFKEVEVWLSYDNANWEHLFNATDNFQIDPVEEGVGYYVRLKTVSIWDTKQQDDNDLKLFLNVQGYVDLPASLSVLYAIVNANSVNLYADKVDDPDVELYEFRLGASWAGSISLASQRAPNLSLYGVKPGSHTFIADTYSNNGNYGETPVTASVVLQDPPDGWVDDSTQTDDYKGQ